MIPGEIVTVPGEVALNAGRPTLSVAVTNATDRPIQVGSHFHFYEVNAALEFDREPTRGYRLDLPAGDWRRFEPGETCHVVLVPYAGAREVYGFNGRVMGALDTLPANQQQTQEGSA